MNRFVCVVDGIFDKAALTESIMIEDSRKHIVKIIIKSKLYVRIYICKL